MSLHDVPKATKYIFRYGSISTGASSRGYELVQLGWGPGENGLCYLLHAYIRSLLLGKRSRFDEYKEYPNQFSQRQVWTGGRPISNWAKNWGEGQERFVRPQC